MEDEKIIDLYFARSEQAIQETDAKYGGYCYSIAFNILTNQEDSEECVSDTYLSAWNTMPPKRPKFLSAFLGRITRYISIDRWRKRSSIKRGGGKSRWHWRNCWTAYPKVRASKMHCKKSKRHLC